MRTDSPSCSEATRPTMSNHADAQQDKNRKIESSLPEQTKSNLKADTRGLGRAEFFDLICFYYWKQ